MELQAKVYTRTNETGVHYARIVVPKELRAYVAKPALWRSLSTKDDKEATNAGSVVAASTQVVLQEVSDAHCEAAVVTIATELVGNKFDLATALDRISQEDISLVAQSLREKLGIKSDDDDKPNGENKGGTRKKTPPISSASNKAAASGKSVADKPKKMEQGSVALSDGTVAKYIEKRPHGIYRLRVWIPRKLQDVFGQREVRQTLKTADKSEAIARAEPLLRNVLQQLHQLPSPA